MMRRWYVLDSYGCLLADKRFLGEAMTFTVPTDHLGRDEPCTICTKQHLGGGVYEVQTCEGFYTITRHRPDDIEAPLSASTTPEDPFGGVRECVKCAASWHPDDDPEWHHPWCDEAKGDARG